ncbi:IS3 family transposase [Paraburkholderia sp. BR10954]|uniref:IS3 family transposase n=1 Tax=Paraburkholderia sp. BR10954 TaxID=3236995 RepID=UPI0034D2F6A4
MVRPLRVSTSGYYAWLVREPSTRSCGDAQLLASIRTLHASSRGTYGAPRIHVQLAREGVYDGRKRVARLMHMAGLRGASRRRWSHTTRKRVGHVALQICASALLCRGGERAVCGGRQSVNILKK